MNFLTLVDGVKNLVSKIDFIDFANGSFRSRLQSGTLTGDRTAILQDASGTIALTADITTLTTDTFATAKALTAAQLAGKKSIIISGRSSVNDGNGGTFVVEPITIAATANTDVNLSVPGATINGVVMAAGQVVKLAAQTTNPAINNGYYIWNTPATPLTRLDDDRLVVVNTAGSHKFTRYIEKSVSVYVDSTAANDYGDGTIDFPKKTINGAVSAIANGGTVKIKRGQIFRERVDLSDRKGITFEAYGDGVRPIVSGQDIVTAFTNHSGNVYTFTVSLTAASGTRGYAGLFEEGIRLREVMVGDSGIADSTAAIAFVQANPGSFFFAGPGSYTSGWTAGTKTYYMHAGDSANPATNNKTYEVYARDLAFAGGNKQGILAKNIRLHSGWFHDGTAIGLDGCTIERSARHGCLPSIPTMVRTTIIAGNPHKSLLGSGGFHTVAEGEPPVVFESCKVVGTSSVGDRVPTFSSAFYGHTISAGNPIARAKVLINGCEVIDTSNLVDIGSTPLVTVSNMVARGVFSLCALSPNQKVEFLNLDFQGGTTGFPGFPGHRLLGGFPSTATLEIKDSVVDAAGDWGFYNSGSMGSLTISRSLIVLRIGGGVSPQSAIVYPNGAMTRLEITDSIIVAPEVHTIFRTAQSTPPPTVMRRCLVVGLSDRGAPIDPRIAINYTDNRPLTLADPSASVYVISPQKVLDTMNPGDVRLKYGSYQGGDRVYSGICHSIGDDQPRSVVAVGDDIVVLSEYSARIPARKAVPDPASHLNAIAPLQTVPPYTHVAVGNNGICAVIEIAPFSTPTATYPSTGVSSTLRAVAGSKADGAAVIAVGDGGTIIRSTDRGATWTVIASNTTRNLRGVAFNGSTWVAVGDEGRVLRSTDDGVTWTEAIVGSSSHYCCFMASAANLFLIGGDAGSLKTSPDGITWTDRATGSFNRIVAFAESDGGRLVAAMRQTSKEIDTFLESTNGTTWTISPATVPFEIRALAGSKFSTQFTTVEYFWAIGEAESYATKNNGPWQVSRFIKPSNYESRTLNAQISEIA